MSDLFQKYKERLHIKHLQKAASSYKKKSVTILIRDNPNPNQGHTDDCQEPGDSPLVDMIERENTILLDPSLQESGKRNSAEVLTDDQATPRSSTTTISIKEDSDAAIARALHLMHNYIPEKKPRPSYLTKVTKRWRSTLQKVVANTRTKDSDTQSKILTEEYEWVLPSVNERVIRELRQEKEEALLLIHNRPIFASIQRSHEQKPFFAIEGGIKVIELLRSRISDWPNLISADVEGADCVFNSTFAKQMISYTPNLRNSRTGEGMQKLEGFSLTTAENIYQRDPETVNAKKSFKVGINIQGICSKILNENRKWKHTIMQELVPNQKKFPHLFGKSDIDIFEVESIVSESSVISNSEGSENSLSFDYYNPQTLDGSYQLSLHPLESKGGETCDWNELQGFLDKKRDWLRIKKRSTGMIGIQQLQRVNKILEEEEDIQRSLSKALSGRITPKLPVNKTKLSFRSNHLRIRSCPQNSVGQNADRHLRSTSEELKEIALSEERGLRIVRKYLFPIPESHLLLEMGTELDNLL